MSQLIAINDFVRRQTTNSQYTDYNGTWEELRQLVEKSFKHGEPREGYRYGVCLIEVCANGFYTYNDFPRFEGMKLSACYEKTAGREHEPPQIKVKIEEDKIPCSFVDIVLYRHDVLAENNENTTDAEWEIISINGRLSEEPLPMEPLTIVRNWKQLPGGSAMPDSTPEEVLEMLCESIMAKCGLNHSFHKEEDSQSETAKNE
ncbi:hypothetical protein LCGC14_1953130 [marine sediment metagenome]|uniref:Uncharacterized protein n=1 Tax=marine sediment metagenome TaxID=412755 RepID=A0A0F9G573_9ZZZZ